MTRMGADCGIEIGKAPLAVAPILAGGVARPDQRIGQPIAPRHAGQCLGQQGRLVEPPRGQTPPMQRDRHDQRISGQKIGPRPRQPWAGGARHLGPVGMFQAKHKFAPVIGVMQHGTPMPPRACDTMTIVANQDLVAVCLPRQTDTAQIAGRPKDEGRFAPTRPAKREITIYAGTATEAFRRKHGTEQRLQSHPIPLSSTERRHRTRQIWPRTAHSLALWTPPALRGRGRAHGWIWRASCMTRPRPNFRKD